jgi:hypothetical protein
VRLSSGAEERSAVGVSPAPLLVGRGASTVEPDE